MKIKEHLYALGQGSNHYKGTYKKEAWYVNTQSQLMATIIIVYF